MDIRYLANGSYSRSRSRVQVFSVPLISLATEEQKLVAYVNIISYYLVGIPVGVALAYFFSMQVKVSY